MPSPFPGRATAATFFKVSIFIVGYILIALYGQALLDLAGILTFGP